MTTFNSEQSFWSRGISTLTRKNKIIIALFCGLKLTMHLLADYYSGFQADELLHIQAGNHLAFGYMEFPPLIGLLAFIHNAFNSHSVFVHHIFTHIASLLIVLYVAKITIELGGKNIAVFLVLLGVLIAPGFGRSQQLFQPVVFSQLFWVLSFYHLMMLVKYLETRYLWLLTVTVTLGFMTKYDAIFFIVGLSSLFLFRRTREFLFQQRLWQFIGVSLLLVGPNLIWQYVNDFPILKMMHRLYEVQLNSLEPIEVLTGLVVSVNPLNAIVVIFGFVFLFKKRNALYLPLAAMIILSSVLLVYFQGKGYYFYPIVLTILPFGIVAVENLLVKRKWAIYPVVLLMIASGWLLIPFGMPVNDLDDYLENIYPHEPNELVKGDTYRIRFEERYTQEKWPRTMEILKSVYDSLANNEKREVMIWGKHYGQAGAVNLFREAYQLPEAFSLHGSFYNWVPQGKMPETVIALGYDVGGFFNNYFEEVEIVKEISNPYSNDPEQVLQRIYICRNPKQDFDKLKYQFRDRIYE